MTKNKIILLSSVVSMLYGFDAYAMEALKAKFATAKAAQQAQSNALSPVSPTLTSNTGSSSSVQNAQLQQSGTPSAPSQGAPTISSIWNTAPDQGDYLNKGSIPSDVGTLMGNTDPAFKSLRDDITQNYTENGNITFANLQQNEKDKLLNKQITYKGYKDIINSDLLDSGKYNDKGGEFAAFFKAAKDAFDSVNENGVIKSLIKKDEWETYESEKFINETFSGSLPKFLTAFSRGSRLTKKEIEELKKLIEQQEG